jgi:hypothetical protein
MTSSGVLEKMCLPQRLPFWCLATHSWSPSKKICFKLVFVQTQIQGSKSSTKCMILTKDNEKLCSACPQEL